MFIAKDSSSGSGPKVYYTGVENVKITCINPNQEELKQLGITTAEAPVYLGKDDKGVAQVRITCFTDNADSTKPFKGTVTFYIKNAPVISSKGTQLFINEFGETAYLPKDGSIPENMKWFRTQGMRAALDGEEHFVTMIKNYLNTPKDQECYLENPGKLFSGDFSEIKDIPKVAGNNKVGILWGVKTTAEGKHYQNAYTRIFLRQYAKVDTTGNKGSYEYLRDNLAEYKANGGASTVNYGAYPFAFAKVEPGVAAAVTATSSDDLPF